MRINQIVLLAWLILSLSPLPAHKEPPSSPHEEARRILRQRLSTDEKRGATNVTANARVFSGSFPWRVLPMKLLTRGIGWAQTGHGLFWTEDGGKDWKDITPHHGAEETPSYALALSQPFFLDTHRGWLLLAGCSADNPKKLEMGIELLSTTDSGASWSRTDSSPLTVTHYGNPDGADVSGCGDDFAFVDPLHGWINVTVSGVTMNSRWAFLLTTSDGGRTWKRALHAPALPWGRVLLLTHRDGWLKGGPGEPEVFVTHDAANSWKEVTVKTPTGIAPEQGSSTSYALPSFLDAQHGFLPVSYLEGLEASTTVLFKTKDGGRTWKPDRRISEQDEQYGEDIVVGDAWIFVSQIIEETHHQLMLRQVGAGEEVPARPDNLPIGSHRGNALEISFITPAKGWVVLGNGDLLSTSDGGRTWTDITPGPKDWFNFQDGSP